MPVNRRKFDPHIKSLVHFDFPYYAEPSDGCRDEINGNIFVRYGNVMFVGTEFPCDEIVEGTPKFGYRCLCSNSNSDFIAAPNQANIFSLKAGSNYEFEFFVKAKSQSTQGNIMRLMKDNVSVFTIAITPEMRISVQSPALNINSASSEILRGDEWYFVRVCLYSGNLKIYVSGEKPSDSSTLPSPDGGSEFTDYSAYALVIDELRLGGLNGFIDEFLMRDSKSTSGIPDKPHQAFLDVSDAGGYGNGVTNITLSSDKMINSYALVKKVSGQNITLGTITKGQLADFSVGGEVMIHVSKPKSSSDSETGFFAFRKILGVKSKVLTLDSPVVNEFDLASCVSNYYVQAIAVPNLNTFNLPSERTIKPRTFGDSYGGGIIIIRCKSDMNIDGKIITAVQTDNLGPHRTDKLQGTHSDMINRFLINDGGGIILICGGTLRISSTAKIGAEESALPGYGGNSAGINGQFGAGGVGGGGGGSQYYKKGTAQYFGFYRAGGDGSKSTGAKMYRPYKETGVSEGGTQGITSGANGLIGGSGGAGGNASRKSLSDSDYGYLSSGAGVIIIANKLSLDENALMTGGLHGLSHTLKSSLSGSKVLEPGSGTGFCYIAAKELI